MTAIPQLLAAFLFTLGAEPTASKMLNFFTTQALAQSRCPTETVVWVDLGTKIFYFPGPHDHGYGTYMCESKAKAAGYRADKNDKRL